MFCSNCGGKLDHEVRFCSFCGKETSSMPKEPMQAAVFQPQTSPRPSQPPTEAIPKTITQKAKGKYFLFAICGMVVGIILLLGILFATGMFSSDVKAKGVSSGITIEGSGFSTPEDAAKAYLNGLRDQDMDEMLAAFAVESYVDNYDLEIFLERINAYYMNSEIILPNTNDYTRQINVFSRTNSILGSIRMQYMLFNAPDEMNGFSPIMFTSEDTNEVHDFVVKFEQDTDNYIFEDLVITGTMQPEELAEVYLDEKNLKNIAAQAKAFGADAEDVANVVITFEADGQTWVYCPQTVRYDNKWYLQSSQGNLAQILGMSTYTGGIAPYSSGEVEIQQSGN